MNRKPIIPVYEITGKTIVAYVTPQTTSIGAAKAAGSRAAFMRRGAWVAKA